MPYDFYKYLKNPVDNSKLMDMPVIKISKRKTDKFVTYDKAINRLDYIAGQVYQDETLWRLILWANPEYFVEYDIPTGTVIRVPFPTNDVISEVTQILINNKDK